MSLYNTYRPKSFNDLFSKFELAANNFNHHAFLFFGPPGTGKTSCARLMMAAHLPEKDLDQVVGGKHPDYIEVNCAVNNGVDDVRTLISDIVNTSPISSTFKFIVMDEAHMLSVSSQNALLKVVEEPPKHIKFVFCTTEINKVLPAIRSRCQIFPFFKLSEKHLFDILKNVCEKENFKYKIESLNLITSCSDGSARNALNLLERCSNCLLSENDTALVLNTASLDNFHNLTKFICEKNKLESLKLIEQIFENSVDPNSIMNKYADYIADLILLRISTPNKCEFDGKKLMILAACATDILKDFKILQNIKLISKLHVLKAMEKL
jgi:DNA polymerase-3 subunit gamma/tau